MLHFNRVDAHFDGRYRVRLSLSQGNTHVFDTTIDRRPSTTSYAATTGERIAIEFFQIRATVPDGEYTATAELVDAGNDITATAQRQLTARFDPSAPLEISGLLLVSRIVEDSTGYVMAPMITDDITTQGNDGYFLFFEAYNRGDSERVTITTRYESDEDSTTSAAASEERTIPRGRSEQWIHLPSDAPGRGTYALEVQIADSVGTLARGSRTVRFEGDPYGLPVSESELHTRIEQMRWVASPEQIERIDTATGFAERRQRFEEFWRELDPSPGTSLNEAMEEYFRRIDYADQHFTGSGPGWRSDQGRIYTIFGPPDRMETDAFRSDGRSSETWHYYRRGTQIVFVDNSGFGDFRLATPVPMDEHFVYGG